MSIYINRILCATKLYEALGIEETSNKLPENELKLIYKKILAKIHPDKNDGDKKAEEAFKKLQTLYNEYYSPKKILSEVNNLTGLYQKIIERNLQIPLLFSLTIAGITYLFLTYYFHYHFYYLTRFFYTFGMFRTMYLIKNWKKEENKVSHFIGSIYYSTIIPSLSATVALMTAFYNLANFTIYIRNKTMSSKY